MIIRSRRSLKAKAEGLEKANKAVLKFASKMELAAELEISRATVQNFFAGKAVGRENFHKICQKLQLDWEEIAQESSNSKDKPNQASSSVINPDLETLVEQLRTQNQTRLEQKCGLMRVLDMSQPRALGEIYTHVNLLEKINGRRRLELTDLLQACNSSQRPQLGHNSNSPLTGSDAIQRYPKLIVLGKPGAGKTTFLKHIALQCAQGQIQPQRLPIFISLKDFAETENSPSLPEYISSQLAAPSSQNPQTIEPVLSAGLALVLLDGLDEIREIDAYRVFTEVRQFTAKYHRNHYVISCRLGAREYTLEEFTEVEVADFSAEQIASFVDKWFTHKDPNPSENFLVQLQHNPPIQELATNPLLLTLLCLAFEESGDFPASRVELYQEGLAVMLRKWDAKRNIERQQVYQQLSVQHKQDLLGHIAFQTFERGDYFFRQAELEQQIAAYICNIPSITPVDSSWQIDSEAVLKSIEAQHGLLVERAKGIYSFSHLTFQEYFTAREIVCSADPRSLETAVQQLAQRVTQPRWREVFLLSVGMLRHADYLLQLMQRQVNQLLAEQPVLQAFLTWVQHKALSVSAPYPLATVRAFYLDLDLAQVFDLVGGSLDLARSLDFDLARTLALDLDLALDRALARALALSEAINFAFERVRTLERVLALAHVLTAVLALAIARANHLNCELAKALSQLKQELSDSAVDAQEFSTWWKVNGQTWTQQLRATSISQRNLGHNWQFNHQHKEALKQYYNANQLLVDCLNSARYVTRTVRQEIEETLLLPIAPPEI